MNCKRVDEYFARLDKGRFPVERGFHYTDRDLSLTVLFQMLQCLSVDLELYENAASTLDPDLRGWLEGGRHALG